MTLATTFVLLFITCLWGYIGYKIAQKKGRNPTVWCILGVLFGMVAIIILSLLKTKYKIPVQTPKKFELNDIVQDNWYFVTQTKEQKGPMSFEDFKSEFESGAFTKQSFVWNTTYTDWKKLEDDLITIKELEKKS